MLLRFLGRSLRGLYSDVTSILLGMDLEFRKILRGCYYQDCTRNSLRFDYDFLGISLGLCQAFASKSAGW